MKVYVAIAMAVLLIFSIYEIYMEEEAIRNLKMEINDAKITHITFEYVELKIYVKFINDEKRDINEMRGNFKIFILNSYVGDAHLKDINIKSGSSYNATIPLRIYYEGLTEGIINAIKEGKISLTIKGKITGRIFFGLIEYSQNIEAVWQ